MTIYDKAVQKRVQTVVVTEGKKRDSSSSEDIEQLDTSDETNLDITGHIRNLQINDIVATGADGWGLWGDNRLWKNRQGRQDQTSSHVV